MKKATARFVKTFSPRNRIARHSAILAGSIAALVVGVSAPAARATTLLWDSDTGTTGAQDGSGTWSDGGLTFWNGTMDVATTNDLITDIAQFGNGGTLASAATVNVDTQSISGLIFGATTTSGYILTNGSASILTLGGNGIVLNSGAQATTVGSANLSLALGAAQTWTNNSTSLFTVGGNIDNGANLLTFNGTGNTTITGIIGSGAIKTGGLTKTGTGILILGGNNSYTGTTTINAGTLISASTTGLGGSAANTVSFTGTTGILDLQTDGTGDLAYKLSLGSGVTGTIASDVKTGTVGINHTLGTSNLGGITLNITKGLNVLSGTPSITMGGVTLSSGSTAGVITILNPTTANLFLSSVTTSGATTGTKVLQLDGTIAGNTISGVIGNGSSTVAVTKTNTSMWTLSGANTYTGATTITAGTLGIGNNLALQNSALDTTGAGVVTFSVTTPTIGGLSGAVDLATKFTTGYSSVTALTLNPLSGSQTYSGVIANGAAGMTLTKSGTGTQILSGNNTYTGVTTISAGTLMNGSATTFTNKGTLTGSAGIFDLNGFDAAFTAINAGAAAGTITNTSGTLAVLKGTTMTASIATLIKGNLQLKVGNANSSATLIPTTTANTFTGGTVLETSATGTRLIIRSAITTVGSAGAITSSPYGTGAITIGQVATDKAQIMFDTVANNTLANNIVVNTALGTDNAAAIRIDTAGHTLSGTITANLANAKFYLPAAGSANVTGKVTGGFGVEVVGAGTLTLSNATNNYSGATQVTGGTLTLSGTGAINSSSGIIINGSGAKFLQTSSVAGTTGITLTQGTLTGSGTVGAVTVGAGTGGIISNNNGVAGASLTTGALTFNGAATVNLFSNGVSTSALLVAGALSSNAAGTVTINPTAASWTAGTYDLISYTGLSIGGAGFGQFALGPVVGTTSRQTSTLGNSGTAITLAITGSNPIWTGALSSEWSTNILANPKNWTLTGGAGITDFIAGDVVIFDDTATLKTVDISNANVSPSTVTFTNTTGNDYTLTGTFGITGSSFLSKTGSGTLTINNTNTFTVGTTITAGTLVLGHATDTLANTGAVTVDGATAVLSIGANSDTAGAVSLKNGASITGSGGTLTGSSYAVESGSISAKLGGTSIVLTKTTTGTVTLSGANTYTGATNITAGTLKFSGAGTLATGSSVLLGSAGTLDLNGTNQTISLGTSAGTIANNSGSGTSVLTLNTGGGTPLIVDSTANPGGKVAVVVTVNSQSFNTLNTYSGGTTVNGGAYLYLGATGSSAGTGTINLLASTSGLVGNAMTIANDITGAGYVHNNVLGGATITLTGNLTTSGSFIFRGGTTDVYNFAGNGTTSILNGVIGSTTSMVNGAVATGSIIKSGTGILTLSGTNLYSGTTTISGGTLATTAAVQGFGTNLSGISIQGAGTLSLKNDSSVSFTNGTSAYNIANSASGATINVDRVTGTGSNTLTVGNLTTTSTASTWQLNFTGANGVSLSAGALTTPAATLAGGATHTINNNITGGGSLTLASVAGAGTIANSTLVFTGTANTTVTGAITQAATGLALTKNGSGTLTLNGTNTYSGTTTVTTGTLELGNNLALQNAVAGNITINGGTLKLLANEQIANTSAITQSAGAFDLNGKTETVGSYTKSGGTFSTGVGGQLIGTLASVYLSNGTDTINANATIADGHVELTTETLNVHSAAEDVGGTVGGILRINSGGLGLVLNNVNTINLSSDTSATTAGSIVLNGDVSTAGTGLNTIASTGSGVAAGHIDLGGTGARTFTVADTVLGTGTDLTVSAVITGGTSNGLTKSGAGTLTLTGSNTFTGATVVSGGTLEAGVAGALGQTASIAVNNSGTLLLSGTGDRIGNGVGVTLGLNNTPGTLSMQGLSSQSETLGSLTLSANSTIDFGTGSGNTLTFSGLSLGGFTLSIYNWSGNPNVANPDTGADTTQDRLLFTTGGFTDAQLSERGVFRKIRHNQLGWRRCRRDGRRNCGNWNGDVLPSVSAAHVRGPSLSRPSKPR